MVTYRWSSVMENGENHRAQGEHVVRGTRLAVQQVRRVLVVHIACKDRWDRAISIIVMGPTRTSAPVIAERGEVSKPAQLPVALGVY